MSRLRSLYFLSVFILIVVLVESRRNFTRPPCRTYPRHEPGVCVPKSRCSPQPHPHSVVDSYSHCDNTHHVCCDPKNVTKRIIRRGTEESEAKVRAGTAMLQQQTSCGTNDADDRNGQQIVSLTEFPWMALLVYSDGDSRKIGCGGSLIHERYVLTAARCIRLPGKKLKRVRLGDYNTLSEKDCLIRGIPKREDCNPPMQRIDVKEAIYHQDYNASTFSNDIALIRLVSNAVITNNVRPICLPITEQSQNYPLSEMLIAGWGRQGNEHNTTILKKAVGSVLAINDCQKFYPSIRLTQKEFCVGGDTEYDACRGDSGGPLFYNALYTQNVRYIQYGLTSSRNPSCDFTIPHIYVRVEAYLPWIYSNLKSN